MPHLRTILLLTLISSYAGEMELNITQELVDSINKDQHLWKAGIKWVSKKTPAFLQALAGLEDPRTYDFQGTQAGTNRSYLIKVLDNIPESFDARDHWPKCKSIGAVQNQGYCGSCWAVSAATTMTDRLCIATNGSSQFEFSAQDIITCCKYCATNKTGCKGGRAFDAWQFWRTEGVVSGGGVYSKKGCKPYSDIVYHYKGFTGNKNHTSLPCSRTCLNKKYKVRSYAHDKRNGLKIFALLNRTMKEIQSEIITNGPVQANMEVFQDFVTYQNGIYFHKTGQRHSWHSVVLIGWSIENDIPYWLGRNSWGNDWGLNGFFKIRRGTNEVNIEEVIFGGIVNTKFKKIIIENNSFRTNESTSFTILILFLIFSTVYH